MAKKYKNKKGKRRYRKRQRVIPLYRNVMGLGPKLVRSTRYVEKNVVIGGGAVGTADSYVFSANGIYDPNISGIGHQPIGFDQIMQFYDHFVVLGSKISVSYLSGDASNSNIIGITLLDNSTEIPNASRLIENGKCRWSQLAAAASTYAGQGQGPKKLTMKCNPAKFLGRSKPLSDSQLKGAITANPAEQCYWHVFTEPNTLGNGGNIQCHVVIDYIVAYIEPKTLTQS